MSRIGKKPIPIPSGVTVAVEGNRVKVSGPLGTLERGVRSEMVVGVREGVCEVRRPSDSPRHRALHGLTRTLLANMVEGVTRGFSRILEIHGVGYRAEKGKGGLVLHLGFSHPRNYPAPEGITFRLDEPTVITVSGPDKEKVGQVAAEIRMLRPPEPYKGKGIRYRGEKVRRKAGKTGT